MRIKEDFVLRNVADTWIVLPIGLTTLDFTGMIKLNNSGAVLWKALSENSDKAQLTKVLTDHYDVSAEQAQADVDEFIQKMIEVGCIED